MIFDTNMGRLGGLLFGTLGMACAFANPHPLSVRGALIEVPLKLRVKIKDFDRGQKLNLSGMLSQSLEQADLKCHFANELGMSLVGLKDLQNKTGWICEDMHSERFYPLFDSLRISSKNPFIAINGEKYRGQLSLIRNGEKLMLVNDVGIEDYLTGLVNKEISSRYPSEAIKAQAIAARSYALATLADRKKSHRLFDLQGDEADQVYQGASYESARARQMVQATQGMVLTHNNDILKAYYHAASGGHSELPQNVWLDRSNPVELGAYEAKPSDYDLKFAPANWSITLSSSIGLRWPGVGKLKDIFVVKRSMGQRVREIMLVGEKGSKIFGGAEFRKMLGNRWLKSTLFTVVKNNGSWSLEGRGFGHGVGMSQLGAREMAKKGKSAQEILAFYYPNAELKPLKALMNGSNLKTSFAR